jgi:hypothetical protein
MVPVAGGAVVEDPVLFQRDDRDIDGADELPGLIRRKPRQPPAGGARPLHDRRIASPIVHRPEAVQRIRHGSSPTALSGLLGKTIPPPGGRVKAAGRRWSAPGGSGQTERVDGRSGGGASRGFDDLPNGMHGLDSLKDPVGDGSKSLFDLVQESGAGFLETPTHLLLPSLLSSLLPPLKSPIYSAFGKHCVDLLEIHDFGDHHAGSSPTGTGPPPGCARTEAPSRRSGVRPAGGSGTEADKRPSLPGPAPPAPSRPGQPPSPRSHYREPGATREEDGLPGSGASRG